MVSGGEKPPHISYLTEQMEMMLQKWGKNGEILRASADKVQEMTEIVPWRQLVWGFSHTHSASLFQKHKTSNLTYLAP